MSIAEEAYAAYSESTGGVSAVTGDKLPAFEETPEAVQNAWANAAAAAAAEFIEQLQTAEAALGEKTAEADALRGSLGIADNDVKKLQKRVKELEAAPSIVENENYGLLLQFVDALIAEGGVHTFQGGVKFDELKQFRESLGG